MAPPSALPWVWWCHRPSPCLSGTPRRPLSFSKSNTVEAHHRVAFPVLTPALASENQTPAAASRCSVAWGCQNAPLPTGALPRFPFCLVGTQAPSFGVVLTLPGCQEPLGQGEAPRCPLRCLALQGASGPRPSERICSLTPQCLGEGRFQATDACPEWTLCQSLVPSWPCCPVRAPTGGFIGLGPASPRLH